ncbi:hypothetical protein JVT61DRAFT_693 [Boletus reticuloceps]|uniref:Chorismate mutase domain-containing protein n=1 Tax=Boletus reticuloceps TaxID=495285 RepID=A0A8I3AGZ9_9AGAM|nr:hypothetical protein JVT61DRAFT_693 [Boletus reticuloceps]
MKLSALYFLATARLALGATGPITYNATDDACYYTPMPNVTASNETRAAPWGNQTIQYANGTTCCSSLDQVQTALDTIDAKLLELLSNRTAYSREAARFMSEEADVDDPLRDQQIIQRAMDNATAVHLPQIVAQKVFQSIINSTVEFEECIYNTYNSTL